MNLSKEKPKDISWDDLDKSKFLTYGVSFLLFSRILAHPCFVIKTKQQCAWLLSASGIPNSNQVPSQSISKQIWKQEGIKGFYRGMVPLTLGLLPSQTIYYASFEWIKTKCMNLFNQAEVSKSIGNQVMPASAYEIRGIRNAELASHMVAGSLSSLCAQVIVIPMDVVSQKLVLQKRELFQKKAGFRNANLFTLGFLLKEIIRNEGIKGVYRGSMPSALSYASGSCIWWAAYATNRNQLIEILPESPLLTIQTLSAISATFTSTLLTNPLDVIKTQIQTKNMRWNQVIAAEKFNIFHKGLYPRLMSSIPISVLMLLGFETAKRWSMRSLE